MTPRHLACHIYPRAHGTWRRTVDHLLARWSLFDGKRVIAIVTDDSTDTAEDVGTAFGDVGATFLRLPNVPQWREAYTHAHLLNEIEGQPGTTLLCHGKGSTHQADSVCQQWADVMWNVLCDYPQMISWAMARYAVAGCFRRYGTLGVDWHYSGSFCWLDNQKLFSRNWREIDCVWFGIESWPARQFTMEESACLFLDRTQDLYDVNYWTIAVEPAFRHWQEQLRSRGLSMTDCSTTDWSKLPETRFHPLIGWGGCDMNPRGNGSSRRTEAFLMPAAN